MNLAYRDTSLPGHLKNGHDKVPSDMADVVRECDPEAAVRGFERIVMPLIKDSMRAPLLQAVLAVLDYDKTIDTDSPVSWLRGYTKGAVLSASSIDLTSAMKLESNPIMNMQESSAFLDIGEKVLGSLCIVIMTFIVQKDAELFSVGTGVNRIGFIAVIIVLLLNYLGWTLYFNGYQSIAVMMFFIAILPPLYYVCIGLWRHNLVLVFTAIPFLFIYFIHVLGNLKA